MPAAAGPAQALPAWLRETAPVPWPQVGRGRLRFWGFEVYDATLWAAPGFRPADFASTGVALELAYLRSFSSAEIARVSLEQMNRTGGFDQGTGQRWQTQLAALLPDVRRGDRLAGVLRPGRGVQFFMNDRALGEIADAQFARLFFGIWLADNTSEPALRQALLGNAP